MTGYIPKGANYTATTIPPDLKYEVIHNIQNNASYQELTNLYLEISSSYLNSLYSQYTKKETKEETKSEFEDLNEKQLLEYLKTGTISTQ